MANFELGCTLSLWHTRVSGQGTSISIITPISLQLLHSISSGNTYHPCVRAKCIYVASACARTGRSSILVVLVAEIYLIHGYGIK